MAIQMSNKSVLEQYQEAKQVEESKPAFTGFGPVFFQLKNDKDRALVRPLLPVEGPEQWFTVWKHEYYNKATNTYEVSAFCAECWGVECQYCKNADKNVARNQYFIIPVYVHTILQEIQGKRVILTWENKETKEVKPVCGVRYLQYKVSHPVLRALMNFYIDNGNIVQEHDFVIARDGAKGYAKTTYSCNVSMKPCEPLPEFDPTTAITMEGILERLNELAPFKAVAGSVVAPSSYSPSSKPETNDIPDF